MDISIIHLEIAACLARGWNPKHASAPALKSYLPLSSARQQPIPHCPQHTIPPSSISVYSGYAPIQIYKMDNHILTVSELNLQLANELVAALAPLHQLADRLAESPVDSANFRLSATLQQCVDSANQLQRLIESIVSIERETREQLRQLAE